MASAIPKAAAIMMITESCRHAAATVRLARVFLPGLEATQAAKWHTGGLCAPDEEEIAKVRTVPPLRDPAVSHTYHRPDADNI